MCIRPGLRRKTRLENGERYKKVKRKPDFLLVLMVAFGMGVAVTLMMPMTSSDTVAAPASALQAGVIIQE